MNNSDGFSYSYRLALVAAHAARCGLRLRPADLSKLASLEVGTAIEQLNDVSRVIAVARSEQLQLDFHSASREIDASGGDADEAIRRLLADGIERRPGVAETVEYAAARGVEFTAHSIYRLFLERGRGETFRYIDQLAAIMDAAAALGLECSQTLAARRLSLLGGNAHRVIDGFAAQQRRRSDRLSAPCAVRIPPHTPRARADAFAGCGCPVCLRRLATQLKPYIAKTIAAPYFAGLDRDEARAEANLELIRSVETWPGGHFTGWFAARFQRRVQEIYRSHPPHEREMLSLDASGVLADGEGGSLVSLGERVPDRSIDVLLIVIQREQLAEKALEQRGIRARRGEEFDDQQRKAA
ncbi:MAG TPA: hypothetical protein VGI52_00130 [Solirubrobacteraceae bacterium]